MSFDIESALFTLILLGIGVCALLMIHLIQRIADHGSSTEIRITKLPELEHKAKDNAYTELAAGKHVQAADRNLEAQKIALKVAEVQERAEDKRLERVRLEKQGS